MVDIADKVGKYIEHCLCRGITSANNCRGALTKCDQKRKALGLPPK